MQVLITHQVANDDRFWGGLFRGSASVKGVQYTRAGSREASLRSQAAYGASAILHDLLAAEKAKPTLAPSHFALRIPVVLLRPVRFWDGTVYRQPWWRLQSVPFAR